LAAARERLAVFGDRARCVRANFSQIAAQGLAAESVDGILADLGVSSLQLDDASRGFSFAESGIDSLTALRLLDDIKKLMEEHGADSLLDEVDVRLLQQRTIAQFLSLLEQFE
jgi:16S rRNA (cytosine1402-N4)-methyltransferase